MKNTDTRIELADQLCEHLTNVLEDFLEARWPRGDESELLDDPSQADDILAALNQLVPGVTALIEVALGRPVQISTSFHLRRPDEFEFESVNALILVDAR
jgi:hypothetical protein